VTVNQSNLTSITAIIVNPFSKGGAKMLSFPVSAFSFLSPTEGWHAFTPPKGTATFDARIEAIFRK